MWGMGHTKRDRKYLDMSKETRILGGKQIKKSDLSHTRLPQPS